MLNHLNLFGRSYLGQVKRMTEQLENAGLACVSRTAAALAIDTQALRRRRKRGLSG